MSFITSPGVIVPPLTAGGVAYGTGSQAKVTSAGTVGQVLQSAGAGVPVWAAAGGGFTLATPVATTSGTSITFTGIPSGVKQIVVSFAGVSTNGTSNKMLRIGDSGGIETADYQSASSSITGSLATTSTNNTGFIIRSVLASDVLYGSIILTLLNASTFTWSAQGCFGSDTDAFTRYMGGGKSLSAVLDRVSITTVNGVDTFDAGEINIAYI